MVEAFVERVEFHAGSHSTSLRVGSRRAGKRALPG
jgi:hypothetical protein